MVQVWSAITTFNVLYLLNLLILDRTNRVVIDIFIIDDRRESVPIFGLTIGTIITILSFYLFYQFVKIQLAQPWHERIPPLWVEVAPNTSFGRQWVWVVLLLCIAFPIAANAQFWVRFHTWQTWSNHVPTSGDRICLYKPVSPKYILMWDAHRYGDFSRKDDKKEDHKGVSYLPLYQPIIMMLLTATVLLLVIKIAYFLKKPCNNCD